MGDVTQFTDLHGGVVWDDGFGGIWRTRVDAVSANATKRDIEAEDAARKADKPGDLEGHPTPPMLEDARRIAELDKRVAADAAYRATQESRLGVRQIPRDQLPKLAGPKCWDDGFRVLFSTKADAECSNIVKTRMEAARKAEYDALPDDVKKALRKKRNADFVQDAIKLHEKIGAILHPLSGKSQKFHEAYSAFALALLDLHDEAK